MPRLKQDVTEEQLEQLSKTFNLMSDALIEYNRAVRETTQKLNRAFVLYSAAYINVVETDPTDSTIRKAPN